MGRVISTAIQFIDGFTKPSKEVINSMKKMGSEAIKAGKQIQNAGKNIASVGSSLSKSITAPIAGIAVASVKTAADFEAAMTEVKVVAGATSEEFDALKETAKQLGRETKFSAIESAEAMQYMAQAGWDTKSILEGTKGVMDAAASSGEDLASVAGILSKNITAFGDTAKDATRYADVLAAAAAVSAADVNYLGEGFKYAASTAGAMNYSVEDVSIALAAMSQSGIEAGTAGAALRNIISNMASPSKKQAEALKQLNLSLTDSKGNTKDFATVMNELRSSFSGLTESQAAAFASTIAGKQSMASLLALVNTSDKDFATFTNAINNSKGTAEEMAAAMQDNLAGQITLLKSGIEGIAITIGDKLLPYIKEGVSWIKKAADFINGLSDAQIKNIMKWAGIAAAVGPAIMIFGKLVTAIGSGIRMFGTITKTIANFKGIVGLITSPAGIVIGVLAAIALAAFLIIKNWDKIKPVLINVGNWFKNVFEKAGFSVEKFKKIFVSIGQTIQEIAGKIIGIVKMIAGIFIKDLFGDTSSAAPKMNETFAKITTGAIKAFDFIVKAVDKGLKVFSSLLDFFTGAFKGNWDSAANGFRESLKKLFPSNIADGLIKAFNFILPALGAAVGAIKGLFKSWVDYIKAQIENIKTIFKGIGQFIKGVFTGDWKGALEGLKTIASGVLNGLLTIIKQPFKAIGNMIKGAIDNFKKIDVVKNIFNAIGNTIKKVLTACGMNFDKFGSNITNIKNRVSSIINNLKSIFGAVFGFIGKAIKTVATVIANIFGKKVSSTCSAAGAVVTALKAVIGAAFNAIASRIKAVMSVVVPVIKVAFSAIKGAITAAIQNITSIISGLMTVFDGITTFISGVFTGNWSKAWDGIKTIFKGVFESLVALCKTPINAIIGLINGAISGINKLGLKIPDWVPVIGGKGFSINIPTIPMLYKGTDNWRGGAAMIHDRGGEIVDLPRGSRVYPHDKSIQIARNEGAALKSGGIQITIQKLADKIEVRSDEDIDRIAEAFALKLKKVALNTGTA